MAPKDYDPRRSSVAVGDDDGGKKRGIIPLVLGLLALLLIAIVIGLVSCGGDDDDDDEGTTSAPADAEHHELDAQHAVDLHPDDRHAADRLRHPQGCLSVAPRT